MADLHLFNSLDGEKQRFEPIDPPRVGLYSCGPTVYARQHLGNLRTYLFSDLLKRTLGFFGYRVRHVINVTDVGHLTSDADEGDDKMERAASREGRSAWEIAACWTDVFQRDLSLLGVQPPDVYCRATDHIADQIAMIGRLEHGGFTYRRPDGLYFDTGKLDVYDVFRRGGGEAARASERIAAADGKRNPGDFALWKLSASSAGERQMQWPSPWGVGFPGWHIECSAMATRYLGEQFDLHTGGIDHVPVHHKNEIAQSEAALGVRPWVRYWLHGGWLLCDGDKMAKSRGRPPHLDDVIARGLAPAAFRYLSLGAHYRTQLDFRWDSLAEADAAVRRLSVHLEELSGVEPAPPGAGGRHREALVEALADDLNAPRALAALWGGLRDAALPGADKRAFATEALGVLGLDVGGDASAVLTEDERALAAERDAARRARDFARADALRDELAQRGIALEDRPDGTTRARRRPRG